MLEIVVAGEAFTPWFGASALPAALAYAFQFSSGSVEAQGAGVFGVAGRSCVVLPRCFVTCTDERERFKGAGQLIRALRQYLLVDPAQQRSTVSTELEAQTAMVGSVERLFDRIEAMLVLWDDWRRYGSLVISKSLTSKDDRGRVHWPRTIAELSPLVTTTEAIYPAPQRTRYGIDPEHPLTVLHQRTCEEIGRWLGHTPRHAGRAAVSARVGLETLDRHERSLFQDRQRAICRELRRYFAPSQGTSDGTTVDVAGAFALGFPRVWERMLGVALGSAPRPRLPAGRYRMHADRETRPATAFLIDVLLRERWRDADVAVIVDAKDYRPGHLPQGDAVNKQILYRVMLASGEGALPLEQIGNAFVAPAVVPGGLRETGRHDIEGPGDAHLPIGRIVCLEIDFGRVADAYSAHRPDRNLRGAVLESVMASMRQ